jgi:hypothetical protein
MFVHEPIPGAPTKAYFLHVRNIVSGTAKLGAVVHFNQGVGPKGIFAKDAEIIESEPKPNETGVQELAGGAT